MTTGDECLDAARQIERAGGKVVGIFSLFDYGIRSRYSLRSEIRSLVNMAELAEEHFGETDSTKIKAWLNQNKGLLRQEEKAGLLV